MRSIPLILLVGLLAAGEAGPLASLSVAFETGDPLRVVVPGAGAKLRLANTGATTLGLRFAWTIADHPNGSPVLPAPVDVVVPAAGAVAVDVPAECLGSRRAIRYAFWSAHAGDARRDGLATCAVFAPVGITAGVEDGFHLGNSTIDSTPEREAIAARAIALVGAEHVRIDLDWSTVQPTADAMRWDRYDAQIDRVIALGMAPLGLIAYGGNAWTKSPETLARAAAAGIDVRRRWPLATYPPRPELWRTWVRSLAERYRGRVTTWEVWNEPDLPFWRGSAEEYVELLAIAHEELKRADPACVVTTGGFANMDHPTHRRDVLVRTLQAAGTWDWLAYHRHGTWEMMRDELEGSLRPLMAQHGAADRQLYWTETAVGRERGRDRDQAAILVQKGAWLWATGAKGWYWFTIWSDGSGGSADTYAMFWPDWSPRPAWIAYDTMARMLRGRRPDGAVAAGCERWVGAFQGAGSIDGGSADDWVLVGWNATATATAEALVVACPQAIAAEAIDLMGNRTSLAVQNGRVLWTVAREPGYLVLRRAGARPEVNGWALRSEPVLAAVPGRASELTVRLRQGGTTPVRVRLGANAPAPLILAEPEQMIDIAGGTEQAIALRIDCPLGASLSGNAAIILNADIGGLMASTRVPVVLATLVPDGGGDARAPDIVLDRPHQVVNNNDVDPTTMHLTWKGAQDLSVRAWLHRTQQSLRMLVRVRDDVHRQPFDKGGMWAGDCLQLAMQAPGMAGWWELGFARGDDGHVRRHAWIAPTGRNAAAAVNALTAQVERGEDETVYRLELPFAPFGFEAGDLTTGLRLNLLVQDLDDPADKCREGLIRLAPGIDGGKDPTLFPLFVWP